jgi:branched-chain amino acid transport system substrate-binding protein
MKSFGRLALATALSGMLFMQGASAQTEPGITDTTIKIGLFSPLSGAGMAYGFDVVNAAKMWYDKVNKEGGIHGRKIELVVEDDRCNANDLVAAIKKLVEQDKVFMLNGGSCSAAVVGAREYIERSKVPYLMLNASGDGALYPPSRYIYGAFSISQHALGGSAVQFAAEHLKAKKIGYINHDDAYGAWNLNAAKAQVEHIGDVSLNVQSINLNINDVTAPVLKIRAANPDVLILTTYARPAALIIKKARELGWTKPIILTVTGTADLTQLVENVGGSDALQNFYIQDVLLGLPDDPRLAWVYDMYKEYYPELAARPGHPQSYMPYGLPSAMSVVETNVMAAPVEFSPTEHAALKSAIYIKFDGKNKELIPGTFKSVWKYTP